MYVIASLTIKDAVRFEGLQTDAAANNGEIWRPIVAAEDWLKQLELAPKTKAHIRSLMHLLFLCAERWELMETGKNPIALVRVMNCTKRLKRPRVLTVEEFYKLLPFLREPYRTMVITAQCLVLRVS